MGNNLFANEKRADGLSLLLHNTEVRKVLIYDSKQQVSNISACIVIVLHYN